MLNLFKENFNTHFEWTFTQNILLCIKRNNEMIEIIFGIERDDFISISFSSLSRIRNLLMISCESLCHPIVIQQLNEQSTIIVSSVLCQPLRSDTKLNAS